MDGSGDGGPQVLLVGQHDFLAVGPGHIARSAILHYLMAAGTIDGNIGRSPKNRKKMAIVTRGGRTARTHYKVREHLANSCWSLVECRLETGRTHQIRVHLTARGHSVVGDPLYGGRRRGSANALPPRAATALEGWQRQALHAYRLAFKHPLSGAYVEFTSEPPADMQELLAAGRE